jgi:hypothetical protein
MAYNPELVKQLLGEQVAELFDGTINVIPARNDLLYGNLKVCDTLQFKFKENNLPLRQFIVTGSK